MKAIIATYIVSCSENFEIFEDSAVIFDTKVIKICKKNEISEIDEIINFGENSILMAGLINSHIHLEFSANRGVLTYGKFINWLKSVMINREMLLNSCNEELIKEQLDLLLKSGVTTIGAISSFGYDLKPLLNSKLRVFYFNEILGIKPSMVDSLYQLFLSRLEESISQKRQNFYPSIAIHSPYSTHPILIKKVLNIAKEQNLLVSAHLLESIEEREWLDYSGGDFKSFFEEFLETKESINSSISFLELFKNIKTMFVHGLFANDLELEFINSLNSSLIHCPISNRLLNSTKLDIEKAKSKNINVAIATDGLSSNYSLNMFNEMRVALFENYDKNLEELSQELLLQATSRGAKALGIDTGEIKAGYFADFAVFNLKTSKEQLASNLILYSNYAEATFIEGERIC